jgi:hypothetical protein
MLKDLIKPFHIKSIVELQFDTLIADLGLHLQTIECQIHGFLLLSHLDSIQDILNQKLSLPNYAHCLYVTLHK